jgi:hypothetical protein
MTEQINSSSVREEQGKKTGGGAAFGGGANFQATLTAIVGAHILRGTPLGWLDGICDDRPVAVWAESEGPGDDLRIELADGSAIEVQAKKGLGRGGNLWSALMALAKAIHQGELAYGILAVASDSSATIKEKLADDIERLGEDRVDRLSEIGDDFYARLIAEGIPAESVCRSLRIRVIDTLISKNGDINAAKNVLRSICEHEASAATAFDILSHRALRLIENRGRWTLRDLVRLLKTRGIKLLNDGSPGALLDRYAQWVCDTHDDYAILGAPRRIPIDHLLPMRLEHRKFEQEEAADALSALERYQKIRLRETLGNGFDSVWTARFRKKAVVVAGPGLGKSTLLRELAHQYSLDGFMVLSAPLKWIAAGMQSGKSFSDLLMTKAFDGSGIVAGEVVNDKRYNLVILLDALDECGHEHAVIADHIFRFSLGYPEARIVVTTRPIGYTSNALSDWVHYTLLPPRVEDGTENLGKLLKLISPDAADVTSHLGFSAGYGRRDAPSNGFATSPQLLGLSAVLIHRNRALPATRVRLYSALIKLFEEAPIKARTADGAELTDIAIQVLDMTGWLLLENPLLPFNQVVSRIGADLVPLIGKPLLVSKGYARDALTHWERTGLVETFFHDGTRLIAFIHKTFCEFVAARYLSEQSPNVIDETIDRDDLHEVINFGVGLGLADKLIDLHLNRHATGQSNQIPIALSLLTKPDVILSQARMQKLIYESFRAIDDQENNAFAIGVALSRVRGDAADLVSTEASRRIHAAEPAIKLIAWALFAHQENSDLDSTAMLNELALTVPPFDPIAVFGKQKQDRSDLKLLRHLALNLLKAQPDSKARDFALQLRNQVFENIGFLVELNAHLTSRDILPIPTALDRADPERPSVTVERLECNFDFSGMGAVVAIAKAFVPGDYCFSLSPPRERALPQMAAFLNASGFMGMPASDVIMWDKPHEAMGVRSTLRYVASLLPLDLEALQQESCELLELYVNGKNSIFDILADVDIQQHNWSQSRAAPGNLEEIKLALLHPSEWLCGLAAGACEPFPMTREELEKLLHESSGHSLRSVLGLIARNHPDKLADLAWQRLARTPTNDVSSIFDLFLGLNTAPSPQLTDITLSCLCSEFKDTSSAATKLLGAWLDRGALIDQDRVEGAVGYWGGREAAKPLSLLHTPLRSIIELSDRVRATNVTNGE